MPKSPLEYPANALDRISETQQRVGDVFCLAPVDKDHPENYVRWLKFQILLYRLDGDYGHIMNPGDSIVIAEQNPSTARPEGLQKADYLSWQILEPANFQHLTMTKCGMVRFPGGLRTNFLVDQDGLETGRLTLVNFKPNGQIDVEMLRRPFNMISVMTYIYGLGWSVDRLKFENIGGGDWANEP